MVNKKRILIIGLDGFTWNLGKTLAENGTMPFLDRILKEGCHGALDSVIPFETSPAWTSFQTGCNPGKTGVFAFHTYDRLKKQIRLNSYLDIEIPTIWELFDKANKKVVSVNMPITSPPPKLNNGIIIPGLLCPGLSSQTVWPEDVFDRYIKPVKDYDIVFKNPDSPDDTFIEESIKVEESRTQAALQIMSDIDWDVFSVQMQSTDAFQHHFWDVISDTNPSNKERQQKVHRFYHCCDNFISKLIEKAGDEALTIMVSDHGFCGGKTTAGLNVWLKQNGYLHFLQDAPKGLWSKAKNNCSLLKTIAKKTGPIFKKTSKPNKELFAKTMESHLRRLIDLDKSKAFCLGGMAGVLYINANPSEKKMIAASITSGIMKELGPNSSNHVVDKVIPAEEVYICSKPIQKMPDLIVSFAEGVEHRISPNGNEIVYDKRFDGTHAKEGFFAAIGKDVKHTQSDCNLIDIAPTILAWMGMEVPKHMDGKVLKDIFISEVKEHKQELSDKLKNRIDYSDEEQAAVEKQLSDLGYL